MHMLVWLLVLLLLVGIAYVVFKLSLSGKKRGDAKNERHYTFKI